ncbi:MAG TPA: hypothetical protein DHW82_11775 [Spirochaetia bacterium]|nr:hypothetical protein [Spirochaetia bacterium]
MEGLKEDLEEILSNPENPSFSIGQKDRSEKLNLYVQMVGREKELTVLQNSYRTTLEFSPQFVFIKGKSGYGKTKLLETFKEKIIAENNIILSFKCSAAFQNIPYAPLFEMFKEYIQKNGTEKILNLLKDQIDHESFPFLQSLFPVLKNAFPVKQSLPVETSGFENKKDLLKSINWFLNLAGTTERSLVFLIDDVQWMDKESLDLFHYLSQSLSSTKLLFIFVISEEYYYQKNLEDTLKKICTRSLFLSPITLEDSKELVQKTLNRKGSFSTSFYQKIYDISNGNPLIIQQSLKRLKEAEILYFDRHTWHINEELFEQFQLNNDIYELLIQRLSSFNEHELEILSMASVFGKEFEIGLLNGLFYAYKGFEALDRVIRTIDKAKEEQLIEENIDKGCYFFGHDKIRETLYYRLSESEHKDLHLICAELLEKVYENDIINNVYHITYHYNKTNKRKKFLYYNELAAQMALSQYSIREASFYMKNAIDFYFENQIFSPKNIALLIEFAKILQITGAIEDSFVYLKKALELSKANNWEEEDIQMTIQIGTGYYFQNNMTSALRYYEDAFKLSEKRGEEIQDGYPYALIGSLNYFNYQLHEAEKYLTKAMEYKHSLILENVIRTYGIRAWTRILLGRFKEGFEDSEYIEQAIKEIDNPMVLSQAYHYCSICYSWSGLDPKKALVYAMKSYDYAEKSEYMLFIYSSLASRAVAYFYLENYDESLEVLERALEISESNRIFIGVYILHAYRVNAYLGKKDFKKANEISSVFLAKKNQIPEKYAVLTFLKTRAVYLYSIGKTEDAILYLDEALALYYETEINLIGVFLIQFKIYILTKIGETEEKLNLTEKLEILLKEKDGASFFLERAKVFIETIEEVKQREETPDTHKELKTGLKEQFQLDNMIQISQMIFTILDTSELLIKILNKILEITGAERGAILFYHPAENQWEFRTLSNISEKEINLTEEMILNMEKTKKGFVYNLNNEESKEKIKSSIWVPFFKNSQLFGLLYLDTKLISNLFNERDLEILNVFTTQLIAAVSIEKRNPLYQTPQKEEAVKIDLFEKYRITKREKEIISLVIQGFRNTDISKQLFVSLITVKIHIHNIFEKTGVKNRVELSNLFNDQIAEDV